jgi:hypothetical protein
MYPRSVSPVNSWVLIETVETVESIRRRSIGWKPVTIGTRLTRFSNASQWQHSGYRREISCVLWNMALTLNMDKLTPNWLFSDQMTLSVLMPDRAQRLPFPGPQPDKDSSGPRKPDITEKLIKKIKEVPRDAAQRYRQRQGCQAQAECLEIHELLWESAEGKRSQRIDALLGHQDRPERYGNLAALPRDL